MTLIITVLLILIVTALLLAVARYVVEALKLPAPFDKLIYALILLLAVWWIVQQVGIF